MEDKLKNVKGRHAINVKALKIVEDGRTLDEQIEHTRKHGIYYTAKVLRNSILGGLEIRKKGASPDNLIIVGCACYGTALPLRSYCLLLEKLGIEYTFLDKEYCCGFTIIESQVFSEEGGREKADQAAREFIGMNIARARELGSKRMIYFCPWCVYLSNRFYPDCDIPQLYAMDILVDRVKNEKLHVEPATVGYFGGIPHRRHMMIPEGQGNFNVDWNSCRRLLEGIEGLKVVNVPRYCCSVADFAIWEFAKKQGLEQIVTPCPVCYGRLMRRTPAGIRVVHMADFLLTVVDQESARNLSAQPGLKKETGVR